MAKADDLYPSRYLKESDLKGRDITLTIERVEVTKIGEDKKPVAYFEGKQKGLVLNKTMFNVITKITGEPDSDDWGGHRITIYPTETEFRGDVVACIRVRLRTAEAASQPPPPPPTSDYEPDF